MCDSRTLSDLIPIGHGIKARTHTCWPAVLWFLDHISSLAGNYAISQRVWVLAILGNFLDACGIAISTSVSQHSSHPHLLDTQQPL